MTGMARSDVADLLTVVASLDQRKVGETDVEAWHRVAQVAGWTRDDAVDAAVDFLARSSDRLTAGRLTEAIRARRVDRQQREVIEDMRAKSHLDPVTGMPLGHDRGDRPLSPNLRAVHDEAADVDCPTCGAPSHRADPLPPTGTRCVWPDGSLTRTPHLDRLKAAGM